jgi:hypothetical protein
MTEQDKRRDQVLERMLRTAPMPHKAKKRKSGANNGKKGRK